VCSALPSATENKLRLEVFDQTENIQVMGMAVFPEWVQSEKLVSELAEQLAGALNETSARAIVAIKLKAPSSARRRHLAGKANEGLLSAEEFAEYDTYAQLRGLLSILQSEARCYLKQARTHDRPAT
jgi:hypothetical protein